MFIDRLESHYYNMCITFSVYLYQLPLMKIDDEDAMPLVCYVVFCFVLFFLNWLHKQPTLTCTESCVNCGDYSLHRLSFAASLSGPPSYEHTKGAFCSACRGGSLWECDLFREITQGGSMQVPRNNNKRIDDKTINKKYNNNTCGWKSPVREKAS